MLPTLRDIYAGALGTKYLLQNIRDNVNYMGGKKATTRMGKMIEQIWIGKTSVES